ncbi:MAG: DUF2971 domain-containing protein [Deltaproteobacteria bacterium]
MVKIYKFKDLSDEIKHPHSHFYQIVLDKTIWCAKPDSLNDDDEFKFKLDYKPSSSTYDLLVKVIRKYRNTNLLPPDLSVSLVLKHNKLEEIALPIIYDVINNCRNTIGIVSFSITKTDNNLWNEYGGKGNGVCIEINIPEPLINKLYWQVSYVPEKIFHIDSFLESALFKNRAYNTYRNILLTKTKRWEQEEEIRFIANRQEVNLRIDGYISEITFGANVKPDTFTRVEAKIINHCNTNNIKITKLFGP